MTAFHFFGLLSAASALPILLAQAAPVAPVAVVTGSLVIAGGGSLPESIRQRFLELGGGKAARVVIVPTASSTAEDPKAMAEELQRWRARGVEKPVLLHSRDRNVNATAEFVAPLLEATAVWIMGGDQARLAEAYGGTRTETELIALLRRGGVIGGTSAGAAIMSRVMIGGGRERAEMATGFDLLPRAIVDQHFVKRGRKPRLLDALKGHPHLVGMGVDEGTAALVRGAELEVLGQSSVTLCMANGEHGMTEEVLPAGARRSWLALQRLAVARNGGISWPERKLLLTAQPSPVACAALVEAAAGPILVVGLHGEDAKKIAEALRAAGASQIQTATPTDADLGERFEAAQALWLGGGDGLGWQLALAQPPLCRLIHQATPKIFALSGGAAQVAGREFSAREPAAEAAALDAPGLNLGMAWLPCAVHSEPTRNVAQPALVLARDAVVWWRDRTLHAVNAGATLIGASKHELQPNAPVPWQDSWSK